MIMTKEMDGIFHQSKGCHQARLGFLYDADRMRMNMYVGKCAWIK